MGSDPALVRMGPGCTLSFRIHGPHQCQVYTTAPRSVKRVTSRGERISKDFCDTGEHSSTCSTVTFYQLTRTHMAASSHQAVY